MTHVFRKGLFFTLGTAWLTGLTATPPAQALPTAESIRDVADKVAQWQVADFDQRSQAHAASNDGRHTEARRRSLFDRSWKSGALFAGVYEWAAATQDAQLLGWLRGIGERNGWELAEHHAGIEHADGHPVGIAWLRFYEQHGDAAMLEPTRQDLDRVMTGPQRDAYQWDWCDALFMSPPVWAQLAQATGEPKYLDFMHRQYQMTYDTLWNPDDRLFYRDSKRFNQRETNGAHVYWARGNGWVYGGLALMIPYLPEDWEHRPFYLALFEQMSASLAKSQREDGTWSMSILGDVAKYPTIETSGTGFFVFGLTRGINEGWIDRETYRPVVETGWGALVSAVRDDGLLGYVQRVADAPGQSFPDQTETYGVGAFLAAAAEMLRLVEDED